jgi:hypothetical protein
MSRGSIATTPAYDGPREIFDPWDGVPIFRTIAVVGNSGSLKGSGLGNRIDGHDCVIRMNAAPTAKYEEDVGSRTTFRFINGLLQQGKTLEYTSTPRKWIGGLRDHRLILMPMKSQKVVDKARSMLHDSNTVYTLSEPFTEYMNRLKALLGKPPSSGVHCLAIAAALGGEVRGFGFGFHQEEIDNRHYWESWSGSHDASHSWKRERTLVGRMMERDNITLH